MTTPPVGAPLPPVLQGWRATLGLPLPLEARAPFEFAALMAHPILRGDGVPAGRGRAVVLVPGFLAGPESKAVMATWLRRSGYVPTVAAMGRNAGASATMAERVDDAIRAAFDAHGPVVVIGHSRGGQQARVAVTRDPERVALLVTLGAPVRAVLPAFWPVRASIEALQFAGRAGLLGRPDPDAERRYAADLARPFPRQVPWVSIWSRLDGVVDWRTCLDEAAEDVPLGVSHLGLAASVPSFRAIADALARLG